MIGIAPRLLTWVGVLAMVGIGGACSFVDHDARAVEASLADAAADPLVFYATHSPTTDPGEHAHLLEEVPHDVAGIVQVVQAVLRQAGEIETRGHPIVSRRVHRDVNTPTVRGMLARIAEYDRRPLIEPRPPEKRMAGICAHFALLTTAALRQHGIPARARGGFEGYISETAHHDHWIAEYWDADDARWVRVDAEIDDPFIERRGITFDPLDLPPKLFLSGAEAWRLCRSGAKPPEHFGIAGDEWIGGWDFVLNELLLDFNALNKVESLPWDEQSFTARGYEKLTAEELALLDRMAATVVEGEPDFAPIRTLFRTEPGLRKD